ncbi:hypothetical protein R6Q59_021042 [Mikania micrantha]
MAAGQVKIWSKGKGSFKADLDVDYSCAFSGNYQLGHNKGLLQQNHEGTTGVVLGLFYRLTAEYGDNKVFRFNRCVMVEVSFGTMWVNGEEHCGCGSSNQNEFGRGRGRDRGFGKGQDGERLQ